MNAINFLFKINISCSKLERTVILLWIGIGIGRFFPEWHGIGVIRLGPEAGSPNPMVIC